MTAYSVETHRLRMCFIHTGQLPTALLESAIAAEEHSEPEPAVHIYLGPRHSSMLRPLAQLYARSAKTIESMQV